MQARSAVVAMVVITVIGYLAFTIYTWETNYGRIDIIVLEEGRAHHKWMFMTKRDTTFRRCAREIAWPGVRLLRLDRDWAGTESELSKLRAVAEDFHAQVGLEPVRVNAVGPMIRVDGPDNRMWFWTDTPGHRVFIEEDDRPQTPAASTAPTSAPAASAQSDAPN